MLHDSHEAKDRISDRWHDGHRAKVARAAWDSPRTRPERDTALQVLICGSGRALLNRPACRIQRAIRDALLVLHVQQ